MTQRLTDYIYLGPRPSHEGKCGMEEGIYQVGRILRALEISTQSLKEYYMGLDTGKMLVPPNKDAVMPPHFRTFTTGGAEYSLRYTERLAKGHPDKVVFVASTEPGG